MLAASEVLARSWRLFALHVMCRDEGCWCVDRQPVLTSADGGLGRPSLLQQGCFGCPCPPAATNSLWPGKCMLFDPTSSMGAQASCKAALLLDPSTESNWSANTQSIPLHLFFFFFFRLLFYNQLLSSYFPK